LNNTITYVTSYVINANGAGFGTAQFSANGLYDPETAIGGHQPLGYDQMMALYNHYIVKSSRITVAPAYASADVPIQIALYIDDDTSIVSSFDSAAERPGAKWQAAFIGDGATLPKLYHSWNAQKTFGKYALGNDDLKGSVSANPLEESYYTVVINGSALFVSGVFTAIVKIEYDVEWSELKTFAQS